MLVPKAETPALPAFVRHHTRVGPQPGHDHRSGRRVERDRLGGGADREGRRRGVRARRDHARGRVHPAHRSRVERRRGEVIPVSTTAEIRGAERLRPPGWLHGYSTMTQWELADLRLTLPLMVAIPGLRGRRVRPGHRVVLPAHPADRRALRLHRRPGREPGAGWPDLPSAGSPSRSSREPTTTCERCPFPDPVGRARLVHGDALRRHPRGAGVAPPGRGPLRLHVHDHAIHRPRRAC